MVRRMIHILFQEKSKKTFPLAVRSFYIFTMMIVIAGQVALAQAYDVGNFQHTFTDPDRDDRQILTEIYYPLDLIKDNASIAEGEFPLLVFGHGFVMTWSAYENLWTHFVPNGYVMAFPRTETGFSPSHLDFGLDIAFLASAIQALAQDEGSEIFGGLNGKTAVMGHSMGGGASVLAAAENGAVHALLPLAPAETSPSAIAAAASVNVPALLFAGSADDVTPEDIHQIPIYEALNTQSKSYVSINGGGHCYFANFNLNCFIGESGSSGNISISREEQQAIVNDLATPWLDYFLKDNCAAWQLFQDSLDASPRITGMQESIIAQPEISQEGDSLISTAATTYQWYRNDDMIPGATDQGILPDEPGLYMVEVTYFNQCAYLSEPFSFNEDLQFTVEFMVFDNQGQAVGDAVITLGDSENAPGDYVFEDINPGSYDYAVIRTCYIQEAGVLDVLETDVNLEVFLHNLTGDANGDGFVNVLDAIDVMNYYTGIEPVTFCFNNADVNQDEVIDVLDVIGIVSIFLDS